MAGQHRSSTSAAVEWGQQYCDGHGQEGPDWHRLLLPLPNLLVPCSQMDFGLTAVAGLDQALLDVALDGSSVAGAGCRLGSAAAGGTDTAALSQAGCPGGQPP